MDAVALAFAAADADAGDVDAVIGAEDAPVLGEREGGGAEGEGGAADKSAAGQGGGDGWFGSGFFHK